jgi:benzoylformate decarboxylase
MDRLAEQHGGEGPWPGFSVDLTALAHALGCPARRIDAWEDLGAALDEVVPRLGERTEPLLLEVMVEPGRVFEP